MSSITNSPRIVSFGLFMLGICARSAFPSTMRLMSRSGQSKLILNGQSTNTPSDLKDINSLSSLDLYNRFRSSTNAYISSAINSSLDILASALRLYGPQKLIASFNGGKDAVVIMHLLRAALAKYYHDKNIPEKSPQFVYFAVKNEFPEVLTFINECESNYTLNLIRYDCGIVQGLERYVNSFSDKSPIAFVLGTRVGDTNAAGQEFFSPSSDWMPVSFMRVNPILNWEYGQVWQFLREFSIPYCSLYDAGYTSLGKTIDTVPNPYLLKKGSSSSNEQEEYWPAYMLADGSYERAGRIKKTLKSDDDTSESSETPIRASPSFATISNSVDTESCKSTPMKSFQSNGDISPPLLKAQNAGLLVIGDEILDGSVGDVNIQVAAKLLNSVGIFLEKVSIISDDVHEIANEVRRFSQRYDMVVTSGGVGPTHDDVTMKGVAEAFNRKLEIHEEMLAYLREISKGSNSPKQAISDNDDHLLSLAFLPEKSMLRFPPSVDASNPNTANNTPHSSNNSPFTFNTTVTPERRQQTRVWPILQCENVFILPGIPKYFATKMPLIVKHFVIPLNKKLLNENIKLIVEEKYIVNILNETVNTFPSVKFGSYPFVDNPDYKTVITLSCDDESKLSTAYQFLIERLPKEYIQQSFIATR